MKVEQIVEATLFASQTPLTADEVARADENLDAERVVEAIRTLRDAYEESERAFQIYQLGDGYQILTRPEYAPYLERFDSVPRAPHLSPAALETLAIIAYRNPIGRIEIEEVRGVSASSVLRTLLDWELVEVVGRGEGLGRPLLYGVTRMFLEHFGLKDLSDLPAPDELPVVLGELQQAMEAELESAEGLELESSDGPDPESSEDPETPAAQEEAEEEAT
ncbi:MAG: SMC-Scp complex subunit ScpB [marine benthic group bacterium]|nr:SMC-Scp complex subunit ScpB [Gemmatimonadota bacterium]